MSIGTILLLAVVFYLGYQVYKVYEYAEEKIDGLSSTYYYGRALGSNDKTQQKKDVSLIWYVLGGILFVVGAYIAYEKYKILKNGIGTPAQINSAA